MQIQDKLETLTADARYDVCSYNGSCGGRSASRFIYNAAVPGRGTTPLLKVLLTNVCVNDCAYCTNQISVDRPRSTFRSEELAKLFVELFSKRMVQGLFLSSGIAGDASRTMGSMIDTVEILRHRYEFDGYIHLKILPGASFDCIEAGCKLATRVSVNIEAPTSHHLSRLSSKKDIYRDILERMRWVKQIMTKNGKLVPSGQTTQFAAGGAGETDKDLLHTTASLYREMELRRVYFSAYKPIGDPRLEGVPPTPPLREHRLYQADWLLRVYAFSTEELELALGRNGNLSLKKDPKTAIAENQPLRFPVDINMAGYNELIHVPGIGPKSAQKIMEARKDHSIFSLQQLKKMHIPTGRAAPYVWFRGMSPESRQTSFLSQMDNTEDAVVQRELSLALTR